MFRVMLFDDEPWILEDLKSIIDWEEMGFELIGEAKGGIEALAIMKKNTPHLIITDIKMPGITGLELLEIVNKKYKGILTIFISAYSEFSYAQQAVALGAFGYLLKPVEKSKLCEALERAKTMLIKNKIQRENVIKLELLRIVNDITEKDAVSFSKVMFDAGIDIKNKTCYVGVVKLSEGTQLPNIEKEFLQSEVYMLPIGNGKFVFLLLIPREARSFSLLRILIKNICCTTLTLGISAPFYNINDIRKALDQANIMIDQSFVVGKKHGCYFYSQQNAALVSSEIKAIISKNDVIEFIEVLPIIIKRKRINIEGLYKLYCEIIRVIYSGSKEGDDLCGDEAKYLVETFSDINEMLRFLEIAANENMENYVKAPSRTVIKEILKFIDENYNKKVLINKIAKQFYLNPSYLSMLFKNETGKSFTTYLVELRLEKAIELLSTEELSLYEISDMVGYEDYFHFSKLFKKYKNISPTNYRKQIKTHQTTMKKHV